MQYQKYTVFIFFYYIFIKYFGAVQCIPLQQYYRTTTSPNKCKCHIWIFLKKYFIIVFDIFLQRIGLVFSTLQLLWMQYISSSLRSRPCNDVRKSHTLKSLQPIHQIHNSPCNHVRKPLFLLIGGSYSLNRKQKSNDKEALSYAYRFKNDPSSYQYTHFLHLKTFSVALNLNMNNKFKSIEQQRFTSLYRHFWTVFKV